MTRHPSTSGRSAHAGTKLVTPPASDDILLPLTTPQAQEDENDVFLKGRAQLIVEVETLMSKRQLMEYALMPPYLHQLRPVQRAVHKGGSSITSRLERLEALFKDSSESLANLARMLGLSSGSGSGGPARGKGHQLMPSGGISGISQGGERGPSRAVSMAGGPLASGPSGSMLSFGGTPGMMVPAGPHGEMVFMPSGPHHQQQAMMDPYGGQQLREAAGLQAQRLKESDAQLPAILRQIDRLQRTVNNQEMRMEGMVAVLRDIENLLRNQQPVIITQESRPMPRKGAALSEAELEKEVKRLLGKEGSAGRI